MGKKVKNTRSTSSGWIFLCICLFLFFVGALFFRATPAAALGTPPTIITYQAKLLNATNSPVSSATNISFVLYDALTAGNALYTAAGTLATPTTMSITPSSGVFAVNLGDTGTNPLNTDIFKNNGSVYLEVSVGGETLTPRKQITSAPFAINSAYLNGYGTATASTSAYIPLSDDQGNFQFKNTTNTGFTTLATTTIASSTITALNSTAGNFVSLFANSLSLASTFGVSGLSTFSGGFVSTASSSVGAGFQVAGALNASSTFQAAGPTVLGNTLSVSSLSTLTGGLISSASSSVAQLQVSGALNASSTLLVNGGTTLNSTLGVTGLTTLTNGLIANASSSFTGPVTVSGPLNASSTFFSRGDAYITTSTITNANITTLAVTSCTGCSSGSASLSANQTFTASNTFSVTTTFVGGVGIGTTTPAAKLAISGGAILAEGTFGGSGATPTDGAGTRLMWIPNKAAFRAGYVNGTQWDASNIGIYSAAFGENNTVSGDRAFGAGTGNTVSQTGSVAFGGSNTVSVTYSGAFGGSNIVNSGGYGYAFGLSNTVSGASSAVALGTSNISSGGTGSAAIGSSNTAGGTAAIALGSSITVNGNRSVGIGLDTTTRTVSQNNAFVVMGGNTGFGTLAPGYTVSVTGTLGVSATSTFTTTTVVSSTITTGNITSLFANTATITTLTVGSCSGCSSGGASLTANQAFTGLNTFSATTTLATTTVAGNFVPSIDNLYDIGASSTRWRYLNLRGGVQIADGTTTSTLQNGSLMLGQTTGYNVGKLYIDTSGNISTSGTISVGGNINPLSRVAFTTTTRATSTLDTAFGAGNGSDGNISMVINSDGFPIVVFIANSTDLRVKKCGNADCSSGNVGTLVVNGDTNGNDNAIALGSDGLPVIAYRSNATARVHLIHCGNSACSSGNIDTEVSTGSYGSYLSLAIGSDGLPGIAVYDSGGGDVRFLHCLNLYCTQIQDNPIDVSPTITTGFWISMSIGGDGNPMMAYYNVTKTSVDYAHCGDPGCNVSARITTTTAENTADQGPYLSLTTGADGFAVMAMRDTTFDRLTLVHCLSIGCLSTDGGNEVAANFSGPGTYNSIKIGVDGFPMVTYQSNGRLMLFKCGSVGCLTPTSTILDAQGGTTGYFSSLAIGADGFPVVAYTAFANGAYELDFLKCVSVDCNATTTQSITTGSNLGTVQNYFNNVYANQFWGKKFKVAAFDVAEDYATVDPTLGAGDVVAFDEEHPGYVRRATAADVAIGIVSTKPGLLLSEWENTGSEAYHVPVALSGRVPLKVNDSQGSIHIGDRVALSSTPGSAAKAVGSGRTIGIAMENFVSSTAGIITVFVNLDDTGVGNLYEELTVGDSNNELAFGTTTTPLSFIFNGSVSVVDPSLARLAFSTTTLLTVNVGDFENAKALILNAPNFNPTSTPDRILFSLRSHNTPVFSVSANGDVNAAGNYYGQSATFGSSTNPGDLAERVDIAADDLVEAGDVMIVDPNSPDTYRRSGGAYDAAVAGVISSNPTIIVGKGKTDYTANLAMVGRVPVKVVNENGLIKRGDLLVASSQVGYAMKYDPTLDNSQKMVGVIGIALDPFGGTSGKIPALIRTGWAYSQNKNITSLQTSVEQIASIAGINLSTGQSELKVSAQNGKLGYQGGDLDLQGHVLLNVAAITAKDKKWSIDASGHFITHLTTSVGTQDMFAMQSPSSEFVFSSSTALVHGEARVVFEQGIQEIIDPTVPLKVTVTLTSAGSKGIYVAEKTAQGFVVKEIDGGTGTATFDWIVVARRREEQKNSPTPETPATVSGENSSPTETSSTVETPSVPLTESVIPEVASSSIPVEETALSTSANP